MVQFLEYAIFGVIVAANLLVGLYYSFKKNAYSSGAAATKGEVFLGSRALKMLPLAASSVASHYSSTGLIGFPAHYYAYGWHVAYVGSICLLFFPLATQVVVPILYNLRVTSIFEYLRLRFNRTISLTSCAIYIFLTQSVAAISIFAASLALATVFNAPLLWSNLAIGISGTLYTALGGLRGVVWTDCLQFLVILIAPTALVTKVVVDSLSSNSTVQPLSDLDVKNYMGDFSLDFTSDENVWSYFVGSSAIAIYRLCLDQMVAQRLLASRTLKDAQRTAFVSSILLVTVYFAGFSIGIAMTIWFRGCDPGLRGAITSIDHILPYYISTELIHMPGLSGLFMAGVVCAATSTVSSTINSQATVLYVDVISTRYKKADDHVLLITRCSALMFGLTITIYSSLIVYMGSVTRIFLMVYSSLTAPFVGLCLLAVLFPFVHSKGAGLATLITVAYELCHMAYIIRSGRKPPRAPVSLDYCPEKLSGGFSPDNSSSTFFCRSEETFFMFRLSHFWGSFFCIFATIIIAVLISAVTGEISVEKCQRELCSDGLVRIWPKFRSQHREKKQMDAKKNNATASDENCYTELCTFMTRETNSTM
ncbi:sodium-coupled monocarboxylate transporter 2-like [Amblyomma americanum]